MYILEEIRGDVVVLTIGGRIVSRPDVEPFRACIRRLAENGTARVVVDCTTIRWFGAAMLGGLVDCAMAVSACGGDVLLAGAGGKVRDILQVAGLASVFPVEDTVEEAVEALRSQRAGIPAA